MIRPGDTLPILDILLLRSSMVLHSLVEDSPAVAAHRFLSAEGRQIVRAMGNRIRLNEETSFDRFVTSPFPDAVQTAELFADRVDYVGLIEVLPALAGDVPPQVTAKMLLARGSSIVVVGDEPSLSALGAFLVGRPTFPPLVHGQVSVIKDRQPAWCLRPGDPVKSLLLVA
jgi:phosphohistidine phosphatase SixA